MSKLSREQNVDGFNLRKGQSDLCKYLRAVTRNGCLSIQWPTGYGKSIGFGLVWRHCFQSHIANRFLLVVANDTQREQIISDFFGDCAMIGAPCVGGVWSFQRSASDVRAAQKKTAEVFVATVQQLDASMRRGGVNTLKDMLTIPGTSWLLGFDEFHHYGDDDMAWGDAAKLAIEHAAFTVAMSATPYRRGCDTIFPSPHLSVSYAKAVEECAVKPMICESYSYQVSVVSRNSDDPVVYSTDDLLCASKDLQGLSAWEERNEIRYLTQFIHPIIVEPLERLRTKRAAHHPDLQMIIRALSCRHAKAVCDQVRLLAPELRCEWVGAGTKIAKTDEENRRIRRAFCPAKDDTGRRGRPSVDILVQVAMAGEGFDSVNVCEVIDLYPVSRTAATGRATQDKQFYGRGSRIVPGARGQVALHVSVPSDHPLHAWAGKYLHAWMDMVDDNSNGAPAGSAPPTIDLYDWPAMMPANRIAALTHINKRSLEAFVAAGVSKKGWTDIDLNDPDQYAEMRDLYLGVANRVALEEQEQLKSERIRQLVDSLVGRIALIKSRQCKEINGSVIGRFKKEINSSIIKRFGRGRDEMLPQELESVHEWLRQQLSAMRPQE